MKYRSLALILTLAGCDSGASAVSSTAADTADDSVSSAIVSAPIAVETAQAADSAAPAAGISVGSPAPDFELPGSDGQNHRLSDYAGQHVVLAFFPKAFTGG